MPKLFRFYRHYTSNNLYVVLGISNTKANLGNEEFEPEVVYIRLKDLTLWTRKVKNWMPRFKLGF